PSPILSVCVCLPTHHLQPRVLPRPSIWAEPGPVIPRGQPVTIVCQGPGGLEAQEYHLHKEGKLETWDRQKPLEPGDKAKFFIRYMRVMHTGRYRCNYLSPSGWSELSEPLELVMTGLQNKPQLSALPSHVVTPGRNVTLQCGSWLGYDRFVLMKEGEHQPSWTMVSQRASRGGTQALFPVGPVNTSLRWTFRCYGYYNTTSQIWSHPSDPLELLASGQHDAPSLSATPGPVVALGGNVSLSCSSSWPRGLFHLLKEHGADAPQHLEWTFCRERGQGIFHVGPVNTSHVGTYRCYVSPQSYPDSWSQSSDPLHLQVTGVYREPSLLAQPGTSVSWGEKVTLQCRSEMRFDTFHLSKEGSLAPPQVLHVQDTAIPYQVNFILSPVTSDLEGTYQCYGSHSTSPYLLSQPSDPLELLVSGEEPTPHGHVNAQDYTVENLIRLGISVLILMVLGVLLFQARHHQGSPKMQPGHTHESKKMDSEVEL
uniref:Ig-like domain-containing protein n=1 Tax=Neovison vison TaxID=452646 RepID=A0A8C7BAK8_NEOVI